MADTNDLVSENIKAVLKKCLEEQKISVSNIDIQGGSIKGDNYLGVIAKAAITGTNEHGKSVATSYIIKSAPKSEALRSNIPIRIAYEREIYIYNTVLPAMKKFQEERRVKVPFASTAKCLTTCDDAKDEALIMEDMKALGYVMQNRKKALDYNHVKLVLSDFGRLHAVSFAMLDQKPELFEGFSKSMVKTFWSEMDMEPFELNMKTLCDKAQDALDPETDREVIKKFEKFRRTCIKDMESMLKEDFYPHCVVRHGDSWTNNFLFAYKDETKPEVPTNLCILDWQISHVSAPIFDLLYFLFATTDKELRDTHYDALLKHYHDTLTAFAAELGSDINRLYPLDVLMQQMQKYGSFGLTCALMLLPLVTSESEEIPDMNVVFEEGDLAKSMEAFNFQSKNDEEYKKRVRDICYFMVERKYI